MNHSNSKPHASNARCASTIVLAVAALFLLALPASAQQCVKIFGLDHCQQNASLQASSQGLDVKSLGPGFSGFTSKLPGATLWAAHLDVLTPADDLLFNAISNGLVVSRLAMGRLEPGGPLGISNGFFMGAEFTGSESLSTYSVMVLRDGVLQGSTGGVQRQVVMPETPDPDETGPFFPGDIVIEWPEPFPWPEPWPGPTGPGFHINRLGACVWTLDLASAAVVHLPGRSQPVVGDEIRIIEEAGAGGSYNYTSFDGIDVLTTAEQVRLVDELVQR